jgi:hypothetical protein
MDNFKAVPLPSSFLHTPDGKAEGLLGEYYNNTDYSGKPTFTRVDKGIDFDWAGESKTLGITLDERAFSYYDPAKHVWVIERGQYIVYAAASSRDLRLNTTVTLK